MVTFHYQHLMAGTSTIQFRAVAASAGAFVLPPIKAFAETQPEVMGATGGGTFTVCGTGGGAPTAPSCGAVDGGAAAAAAAPAKSCPGNCSGGNGACRLDTGVCLCRAGFTGEDCSVEVQA